MDAPAAPTGIEQYRQAGAKVFAVTPIFDQLIEISYPAHFRGVFQRNSAGFYIQESVLDGETVDRWTQMITLTGKQGAAANPQASPRALVVNIAGGFQRTCPKTFAIIEIGAQRVDGYDGYLAIASCGSVRADNGAHSETAMILAVKGSADFYTIQWAQRGPDSEQPLSLDSAMWVDRFRQLDPIRLCARVPGESAPYPSCVERQ